MYSEDEIDIIEKHIEHYYGNFEFVFTKKYHRTFMWIFV